MPATSAPTTRAVAASNAKRFCFVAELKREEVVVVVALLWCNGRVVATYASKALQEDE
jgi:hypothetical protein